MTTTVHTHYDNLKVARNAPKEIIRAAYKTLSQHYHPDRNPGNAEAARIMGLVNAAYDVLSDPVKRKAHDQWIAEQETAPAPQAKTNQPPPQGQTNNATQSTPTPPPTGNTRQANTGRTTKTPLNRTKLVWQIVGVCLLMLVVLWFSLVDHPIAKIVSTAQTTAGAPPPRSNLSTTQPEETTDPHGNTWPSVAGYLSGVPVLNAEGRANITVDNSRNSSDVYARLIFLDGENPYPVRQFFIPALGSFKLKKVSPGRYALWHKDLKTGATSQSEAFTLRETTTSNGTKYSNLTFKLVPIEISP